MPLPLLLLGGLLAGREYQERERDARAREGFAGALGEAPSAPLATGGEPMPQPGSGLRGAFADDPVSLAMLEATQKLMGTPGVRGPQALSMLQAMMGRATSRQNLGESLGSAWEQMLAGQRHGEAQQGRAQDFARAEGETERQFRERITREGWGKDLERARIAAGAKGERNLPPNMTWYPQAGGGQIPGPLPGTEQFATGMKETIQMQQAAGRVDQLLTSYYMGGRGREFLGRTAGEQQALYSRMLSDVAKAEGMGVLQQGELERIKDAYPEPSAFLDKLTKGDEYLLGVMETLRDGFAGDYNRARAMHPWTGARDLPSRPTRESVAAKFLGAAASAEVAGRLKPVAGPEDERARQMGEAARMTRGGFR